MKKTLMGSSKYEFHPELLDIDYMDRKRFYADVFVEIDEMKNLTIDDKIDMYTEISSRSSLPFFNAMKNRYRGDKEFSLTFPCFCDTLFSHLWNKNDGV